LNLGRARFSQTETIMSSAPEELKAAALALPPEERAELARHLIESLDGDDGDTEAAWEDEVRRRLDAYRNGEIGSVPAEDVFEEARRRSQS
jgi:putative addiction module component (TIGR02574 family)